jgi:hypothetical protein
MADPLSGVYKGRQSLLHRRSKALGRTAAASELRARARSERTTRIECPWSLTKMSGGNRLGSRAATGAWQALMLAAIGRGSARCAL